MLQEKNYRLSFCMLYCKGSFIIAPDDMNVQCLSSLSITILYFFFLLGPLDILCRGLKTKIS